MQQEEDIQKYIKLVCIESQRAHKYIADALQLKNENFINYEELLSKINLEIKYRDNKLSKIIENVEDDKFSEKLDQLQLSSLNIKLTKEVSEVIIKNKKPEESINNDNILNSDSNNDSANDSLLQKNYKSKKFNVFPGPNIRNLPDIGSEIKDFQLYYVKDYKNEDYPFDSGLKCRIF